jgi:ankyrin repeat protein
MQDMAAQGGHVCSLAYFYCARNLAEPERADPDEIMRALLKQLCCLTPNHPVNDAVKEKFERSKLKAEEDDSEIAKLEFADCFQLVLEITKNSPVTILIDALDECDPNKRHLLFKALRRITSESANIVKVLVSSRDDLDISLGLQGLPEIYIRAADNEEDIKKFVDLEIEKVISEGRLLSGRVSKQLKSHILSALLQKAQGMYVIIMVYMELLTNAERRFRWVSLQIQQLSDPRRIKIEEDVRLELGRLPTTLSELYSVILNQVKNSGPGSYKVAMTAFRWLLFAHHTLPKDEFLKAVSVGEAGAIILSADDIPNICCNLVVMDSELNIFRFAHLSVREHLERQEEFAPEASHSALARQCFQICMSKLDAMGEEQYCRLDYPHNPYDYHSKLYDLPAFDKSLEDYSMICWPVHLRESRFADPTFEQQLQEELLCSTSDTFFKRWVHFVSSVHIPSLENSWNEMFRHTASFPPNPLFFAAVFGLSSKTAALILSSNELHLRAENRDGDRPVLAACRHQNIDIATFLMEKSAGMYFSVTRSPLYIAAKLRNCSLAEKLIAAGADIRGECLEAGSLVVAAENGDVKMVKLLLAAGAHVNVGCPLAAAAKNSDVKTVELLLAAGADVDASGPLVVAAHDGDVHLVQLLLAKGADINKPSDSYMLSPLVEAAKNNHFDVCKILLAAKATVNNCKYPPLAYAAEEGNLRILRLLLDHGADINAMCHLNRSALCMAVSNGHIEAAKFLLDEGADINIGMGNYHSHVLAVAANKGVNGIEMLELLMARGAQVNSDGGKALENAISIDNKPAVKFLLDKGADISKSALQSLEFCGSLECTRMVFSKLSQLNEPERYQNALQSLLRERARFQFKTKLRGGNNVQIEEDQQLIDWALEQGATFDDEHGHYSSSEHDESEWFSESIPTG